MTKRCAAIAVVMVEGPEGEGNGGDVDEALVVNIKDTVWRCPDVNDEPGRCRHEERYGPTGT